MSYTYWRTGETVTVRETTVADDWYHGPRPSLWFSREPSRCLEAMKSLISGDPRRSRRLHDEPNR
jgi:hypothetical protein